MNHMANTPDLKVVPNDSHLPESRIPALSQIDPGRMRILCLEDSEVWGGFPSFVTAAGTTF